MKLKQLQHYLKSNLLQALIGILKVLLVQLTIKDNVEVVGLGLQLKLLKDFMKLKVMHILIFQYNKLLIVLNTLEHKVVMVDIHNGLMNMLKNTEFNLKVHIHILEQPILVHIMQKMSYLKLPDTLMLLQILFLK